MKKSIVIVAAVFCFGAMTLLGQTVSKASLIGSWKVAEVVNADGTSNKSPQPSLYILTATHYSIQSVNTERPDYGGGGGAAGAATLTDKQRAEMWGPYTANSGTWELKGNELTIHPIVAKNPGVMKNGFTAYTIKKEGDALWITTKANQAGPVKDASRLKLVRVK